MLSPPLALLKSVAICRGEPLPGITCVDAAIYAGCPRQQIAHVRLPALTLQWRVPADGFHVEGAVGGVVALSSMAGQCRALRRESGDVAWTIETPSGSTRWRDRLIVYGEPTTIVEPATAAVEDRLALPAGAMAGSRFVLDDLLLWTSADRATLAAYDLDARTLRWRAPLADRFREAGVPLDPTAMITLIAGQGDAIVGFGSDVLFGVSAATGEVRWVRPARLLSVVPAAGGGRVYAWLWDEPRLLCLDDATGAVIYDRAPDDRLREHVAPGRSVWVTVAGEWLVTATGRGGLALFRSRDGEPVWMDKYRDRLGRAIVVDDLVLVPAGDGQLLAFGRED